MQQLFKHCSFCIFFALVVCHSDVRQPSMVKKTPNLPSISPGIFLTVVSYCSNILVTSKENTLIGCISLGGKFYKYNKNSYYCHCIPTSRHAHSCTNAHTHTTKQSYKTFPLYLGLLIMHRETVTHDSLNENT